MAIDIRFYKRLAREGSKAAQHLADAFNPDQPRDPDGKFGEGGGSGSSGSGSGEKQVDLSQPARVPKSITYTSKVQNKMMEPGVRELSRSLWRESIAKSDQRADKDGRPKLTEEKAQELHEAHTDYMVRLQRAIREGRNASLALDPRWGTNHPVSLAEKGIMRPTAEQLERALAK